MKKNDKVIILHGGATEEYLSDVKKSIESFISPNILANTVELSQIGEPISGFKFEDLVGLLQVQNMYRDDSLNIILPMHGMIIDDEYKLLFHISEANLGLHRSTKKQWIKANDFLHILCEATKGAQLNILVLSCFGRNFVDHILGLPVGSKVITLSERNSPTEVVELYHLKSKFMIQTICKDDFKIEYILLLYCFNQKFTIDLPTLNIVSQKQVLRF